MSTVNPLARELAAKIVYYGPGLSGKTTSLKRIYAGVKPDTRGELISLATEGDRTLFFDFLPIKLERVRGLSVRLQLYTVPGQVFYDATRKLVLNGADGVVFVADSQRAARDANVESMRNLVENLGELGIELERFPLVVQYNKRDLSTAMPVAELRKELNPRGAPDFETVAERGQGVVTALKEIARLVIRDLKSRRPPGRPASGLDDVQDGNIAAQLSATAEAQPAVAAAEDPGQLVALSFSKLARGNGAGILAIERAVRERTFGIAVRAAAAVLAELLEALPARDAAPAAKAALLGLDGREYLRLCRLAGQPDAAVSEEDALFALYVAVAAHVKADRV